MLYNGLLENNCSEQASRMAAMESSTKNAKDMLGKLTLSYNRCVLHALLFCLHVAASHVAFCFLHGCDDALLASKELSSVQTSFAFT